MSSIPASSQSRSKLRAFQYDGKHISSGAYATETGKENDNPELDPTSVTMYPPPQPFSQRSATKDLRDCPQTPVGRLPLTELLASGDDTSRRHINPPPMERVLWENSPLNSQEVPARRIRKRAHSSSPASSSQNQVSTHFAATKPITDQQALQKALKTPKADPADDLWSRYSLHTDVGESSPTAPAGLAITQPIQSLSPQTPASHLRNKEGSGLRRTLSCIEWSTSAAKRRKLLVGGSYSESMGDLAAVGESSNTNERSKMSRVSFLVEKIHDGLTKSTPHKEYSSSEPARSSPVPGKTNNSSKRPRLQSQESQTAIEDIVTVLSQTVVGPKENISQSLVLSAQEIADLDKDECSSDFGDDDLDLDMLETVDITLKTESSLPKSAEGPKLVGDQGRVGQTVTAAGRNDDCNKAAKSPVEAQGLPQEDDQYSDVSFPSQLSSSIVQPASAHYDEFDEEELDASAAELEDVFARYDTQSRPSDTGIREILTKGRYDDRSNYPTAAVSAGPKCGHNTAIPTNVQVLSDDDDDDDFGNDSDFEQIAAECAEATQKQQVSQPQSCVRTVNSGSSI